MADRAGKEDVTSDLKGPEKPQIITGEHYGFVNAPDYASASTYRMMSGWSRSPTRICHPVSLLHAFSFFTPVFGVFLRGVLILGEGISLKLVVALILVSLGTVFVNRRPGRYAASGE